MALGLNAHLSRGQATVETEGLTGLGTATFIGDSPDNSLVLLRLGLGLGIVLVNGSVGLLGCRNNGSLFDIVSQ